MSAAQVYDPSNNTSNAWHVRTYYNHPFIKFGYQDPKLISSHNPSAFPGADLTLEVANILPAEGGGWTGDGTGKGCTVQNLADYDPDSAEFKASGQKYAETLRYLLQRAAKGSCSYYNYSPSGNPLDRCMRYVNEPNRWGELSSPDASSDDKYVNWSQGTPACLESVTQQSPQVIRVPSGIIQLKRPLIIPPNVILIGGLTIDSTHPNRLSYSDKDPKKLGNYNCPSEAYPVFEDDDNDNIPNYADDDIDGDGEKNSVDQYAYAVVNCLPQNVRASGTTITIDPQTAVKDFTATFTTPYGKGGGYDAPTFQRTTRALFYVGPTFHSDAFVHLAGFTFRDAPYEALEIDSRFGIYEWLQFKHSTKQGEFVKQQWFAGYKQNKKEQNKGTKGNAPLYPCADAAVTPLACMQYIVCVTGAGQEYLCKEHPAWGNPQSAEYQGGAMASLSDGSYSNQMPAVRLRGDQNILQHLSFDVIGGAVLGNWQEGLELRYPTMPTVKTYTARDRHLWGNYLARIDVKHAKGAPYQVQPTPVTKDEQANAAFYENPKTHLLQTLPPPQFLGFFVPPEDEGFWNETPHVWTGQGWDRLQLRYAMPCTYRSWRTEVYRVRDDTMVKLANAMAGDGFHQIGDGTDDNAQYDHELKQALEKKHAVLGNQCQQISSIRLAAAEQDLKLGDQIVIAVHAVIPRLEYFEGWEWWAGGDHGPWVTGYRYFGNAMVPVSAYSEPIALAEVDEDGDGLNQYCEASLGTSDKEWTYLTTLERSRTFSATAGDEVFDWKQQACTKPAVPAAQPGLTCQFTVAEWLNPEYCRYDAVACPQWSCAATAPSDPGTRQGGTAGDGPQTDRGRDRGGNRDRGSDQVGGGNPAGTAPEMDDGQNGTGSSGIDNKSGSTGGGPAPGMTNDQNNLPDGGQQDNNPPPADDEKDDGTVDPNASKDCPAGLILFGTNCVANPCGTLLHWDAGLGRCVNISAAEKSEQPLTSQSAPASGGCSLIF